MKHVLCILALLGSALAARGAELFVAPEGDDANPGTRAQPLASIEAARDRLRASGAGEHTITLCGGAHVRSATLALDQRDSGLTLRGEPGARLLGGTVVAGWTPSADPRLPEAARGKVLETRLSGDLGTMRRRGFGISSTPAPAELFVDGAPQTLARWPNGDEWGALASGAEENFGVQVEPARLARWAAAAELWVHGYWTYDWADSYEKVVAIDTSTQTLATAPPHGVYGYKAGRRFYALNLIEELDAPGEYWIDRATGTLFAWLAGPGETVLSTLEAPMITVTDARDITLERLTLACSRGDGIRIDGGSGVTVAGCTIRGLGGSGIAASGGTHHRITSCDLFDLGESGVSVNGGDRDTLAPGEHLVENCDIYRHSRLCRTYRPAIGIQGVGNRALHNRLHDGPHNAILMGGNDHEIAYNEIYRVCTQTGDAGAIYAGRNLTMRGTVIRHNYFHDIGPTLTTADGFTGVMAVYLDDCFCGTTIAGNLFERAGRAAMIGGGRDNIIANNLFIDCNPAIHVDARGTGWASFWFDGRDPFLMDGLKAVPFDKPPYATRYPHLADILNDEPAQAKYNLLANNVIIGTHKAIDWLDGLSEATVETVGNTIVTDAAVVGLDPITYAVRAPGFDAIPFDQIGLRRNAYRSALPEDAARSDAAAAGSAPASAADPGAVEPGAGITVACYYFGNYHPGDPRNEQAKGKGWSEWELVRAARPRFPGHRQPNVPLWGYADESDPKVMAQKIAAAADYGVGAFIFDWYYYDDGPFLDRPIDAGFLEAPNNARLKFAFMWANHDWEEIHPYTRGAPRQILYPGAVTPATFEKICDHVIGSYFLHPSYWRIDGRPYFSFYDLTKLLESFGSVDATRAALDAFRARAEAAGLPGLHLNAVVWGRPVLPAEKTAADPVKLVKDLGFDSVTSYVWVHHVPLPELRTDYNTVRDAYFRYWDEAENKFGVPYFPNVSMGWDSSPRARQEDEFGNFGYPFTNTISGNTPERFKQALELARDRLLSRPGGPRIMNINCWNEWTEGSYLEPDVVNGMRYLEAVRDVFRPPR